MDVYRDDLKPASTYKGIVGINVLEERGAFHRYVQIPESIPSNDVLPYVTVEGIMRDEQEHLEELRTLVGE